MNKPHILTAIPRNRYRLGEFTVSILDEIESSDDLEYRFVAAVIRDGETEPGLYITSVRNAAEASSADQSELTMWVIMRDGSQCIGSSDQWGELKAFSAVALEGIQQILDLQDEEPMKLM